MNAKIKKIEPVNATRPALRLVVNPAAPVPLSEDREYQVLHFRCRFRFVIGGVK